MLALEGVEPFGYEVATADLFWELGLRMAGLTWNRRNPFADGAADEGGLSRLGRALLARFAELEIILDLAHASPQLFDECLRLVRGPALRHARRLPRLNDTPRNLSDGQLRGTRRPRRRLRPDASPDRDRPGRTDDRAGDRPSRPRAP